MTTVGRFTVWVIVAVIAIMVVYFMAYAGWDKKPPPPHLDASATVGTDCDTCRSRSTSTASFSPQAIK